jgi:hypothetical protein
VVGWLRADGTPLDATMAAFTAFTHESWFRVTTIPVLSDRRAAFAPRRSAAKPSTFV